ncbi:uncharacterized protein LOC112565383 [Pomacea canaliculata]|uniref:uncharacterized protein LOC112565383 n=1 Tax=Pomacea canaliculata TaxID=400727 RepID=UPI000D731234|nr:uncharacterized protein LOC112565383 [Pomacea canaliculata]
MHALLLSLLYISAFASGANPAPPGGCTEGKHQVCIQNATCINNVCVCNAGLKGDGRFECVKTDEHVCQVAADPRMRAFEGSRARIFFPCKYRLTRFMTSFRNSKSRLRFCEFEAFSFNKVVDGLHFVGGLEVKVFIYDSGVQQSYQRDFLKFDIDSAGIHSDDSLLRWGTSSSSMLFHGVGVVCKFDKIEKFAILEIEECGVRFKFRAHNPREPPNKQRLMPGLSIQAPASASFSTNDEFESIPFFSLCGRTFGDGDNNTIFNNHRINILGLINGIRSCCTSFWRRNLFRL